ncbi:hypothetical protein SELMODRAFT_431631 [Selaginella moellendorffii]|uniref:Uncharacterized protein n=1 Tax=Selaginella moellendorffii TaxID=88036 RepID=D8TDA0_SELML|nr:hypothetical protein SELMODRAFT_431631 [Selaginella moellendorffii]
MKREYTFAEFRKTSPGNSYRYRYYLWISRSTYHSFTLDQTGTPAALMKRVPTLEVKKRSRSLTSLFESFTPYTGMEVGLCTSSTSSCTGPSWKQMVCDWRVVNQIPLLETMLRKSDASSGKECDPRGVPEKEIQSPSITFSFVENHQDQKWWALWSLLWLSLHTPEENKLKDESLQRSHKLDWAQLGAPTRVQSPLSQTRCLYVNDGERLIFIKTSLQALVRSVFIRLSVGEIRQLKWLVHKHSTLLSSRSTRVLYFTNRYTFLIQALDAWWEHGIYSSSKLCPLIRELTLHDWCVFYEVLSSAFANRADFLSALLLPKLHGRLNLYDLEGVCLDDGVTGMKIWKVLRDLWQRYISWVKVCLHCSDLNYAVRLKRVRAVETLKLYDKGVICFSFAVEEGVKCSSAMACEQRFKQDCLGCQQKKLKVQRWNKTWNCYAHCINYYRSLMWLMISHFHITVLHQQSLKFIPSGVKSMLAQPFADNSRGMLVVSHYPRGYNNIKHRTWVIRLQLFSECIFHFNDYKSVSHWMEQRVGGGGLWLWL